MNKPDVQFVHAVGLAAHQAFKGTVKSREATGVVAMIFGDDREYFVPWSNVACIELPPAPPKKK